MKDLDIIDACQDTAEMILHLYITNRDFKEMVDTFKTGKNQIDAYPVNQVIHGFAYYNYLTSKKMSEMKGENENG